MPSAATSVLPGVYRSDWNTRSQAHTEHAIADYDAVLQAREVDWGDPAALGRAVVEAIEMATPPEQLLVGPTALRLVRQRLAAWTAEIDHWERLSEAGGEG